MGFIHFGKKQQSLSKNIPFDSDKQIAVIKCSICTGEQVAGFKDLSTGKFEDIMLIRNDNDLDKFMREYGIDSITKEY